MSASFVDWGATVRVIVPDDLKESVLTPDIYDPALNPSIATCSRTTASSRCRVGVGDPDRKGKVEAGVGHAQKTP